MGENGGTEWIQVRMPKPVRDRLERFRSNEDEPVWKIIVRLMDKAGVPA